MPGLKFYEVRFKTADVKTHVETRIKERYFDFFRNIENITISLMQTEQDILASLTSATTTKLVDDFNPERCNLKKYEIKGFSALLQVEVRAYAFQDDENKIRFPVTILSNPRQAWFKGMKYKSWNNALITMESSQISQAFCKLIAP